MKKSYLPIVLLAAVLLALLTSGLGSCVVFPRYTDKSSWVIQTVDSAGSVGWSPKIAIDSTGKPHIVYYDRTKENVKYARWNGKSWEIHDVAKSLPKKWA